MVVSFTNTYVISANHHCSCEFESNGEVCSIQHYVIMFVSNLQQVNRFEENVIMVFNVTFNNISLILKRSVLLAGGNRCTRRKPPTCWKLLTNLIEHTSSLSTIFHLDKSLVTTNSTGITRRTIPIIPRFLDDFRLSVAESFVFLYLLVFFLSTAISV
jgi:hypothetical protein